MAAALPSSPIKWDVGCHANAVQALWLGSAQLGTRHVLPQGVLLGQGPWSTCQAVGVRLG